jgi:beta-lactam-binding protein with PASTA domain
VVVPNVVELGQAVATTDLENRGLTVAVETTSRCGSLMYGDVVTQDPVGGASVASGSAVTIRVCAVVTATLRSLGLDVDTNNAECLAPDVGDVVREAPSAGSAAPAGSAVTLTVCNAAFKEEAVPRRALAVDWVNELSLTQSTKGGRDGRLDHH